jgi:hypothetical protein
MASAPAAPSAPGSPATPGAPTSPPASSASRAPAAPAAPAAPKDAGQPDAGVPAIDPTTVTISWGEHADRSVVTSTSETVIREIVAKAGDKSCTITSTARTPADQARAMYNNLEGEGVDAQKELYADAGDKVIDVYVASKAAKKTPDQIKADMLVKINEVGPSLVSNHCADSSKLCVVDITPNSITNKTKFIEEAGKDSRVSKFLKPPSDPAYHLEIPVS